jgi:hypothetical protein
VPESPGALKQQPFFIRTRASWHDLWTKPLHRDRYSTCAPESQSPSPARYWQHRMHHPTLLLGEIFPLRDANGTRASCQGLFDEGFQIFVCGWGGKLRLGQFSSLLWVDGWLISCSPVALKSGTVMPGSRIDLNVVALIPKFT